MVFVKKEVQAKPGFNIGVIMNRPNTIGDIGIEIEVEGKKLPQQLDLVEPWIRKEDHSLRGEESAEYIFAKPLKFDEVPKALGGLWDAFSKKKSILDESNRTSVHVHLNAQSWHLNRLTAFLGMYYCIEEILTEWCGEHRVGNLFCLRAKDAPAIIHHIRSFIRNDGGVSLSENLHYSGLNVHSLKKFGSLELRTLRGVSDPRIIEEWATILRRLYELSAEYPDPRTFVDRFSALGPLQLFDDILGPMATVVRASVQMNDDEIRDSMYEGIRLAQDLCYCRAWEEYKPMEMQPDPFGRPAAKMAKRIFQNGEQGSSGLNDGDFNGGPTLSNFQNTMPPLMPSPISPFPASTTVNEVWFDPEPEVDMWADEDED